MIDNLPAVLPFAENNNVRPLAVSTAEKWPLLPNIPTIGETVKATTRGGVVHGGGTCEGVEGHRDEAQCQHHQYIKSPDGIERIRKLGGEPVGNTPEEMQAFVIAETEKWGKVAEFAKIGPNKQSCPMRRHHMAPHPGTFHPAMLLCRTWRNRFPQAISGDPGFSGRS